MSRGFTLIELMITVAIVGILATIAIASYTWAAERGRRAEGAAAAMAAAQQLERYFTMNNTYTTTNSTAGVPTHSESRSYSIGITAGTAGIGTSYLVTMTPNGWRDSKCGNLTYTNAGVKGKTSGTGALADCWR